MLTLVLLACSGVGEAPPEPPPAEDPGDTAPHELLVAPFLQSVTPTSAWICWETLDGEETIVAFGPTEALGTIVTGTALPNGHGVQHETLLDGLAPDTSYWYTVRTGATVSAPVRFRTAPAADSRKPFQLVAVSDMQRDDAWPDKWAEVVEGGILPYVTGTYDAELPEALGLMLLAGDLVDNGWNYADWTGDFFGGAAPLMGQVPLYPVLGNHEAGSPAYFQYFHLPDNGVPDHEEQWWAFDYVNVRVIGLDSNTVQTVPEQLEWLDGVLAETCTDDTIEFVFAELHHPWKSELWPGGEASFSGDVVQRLEAFSTTCGKPSIHFFGHTHGYSRGQSRDHTHLWVDVASAGGALDTWTSTSTADYEELSVTQAEYGFVVVEVQPGAFTLRRISLGSPEAPRDSEVTDEITVRVDAVPPTTPTVTASEGTLAASPYAGSGAHGSTHWQVSADCDTFADPVVDRWVQHENWYQGIDTQVGADLTTLPLDPLAAGDWCGRARYRDRGLAWSEWSEAARFTVP
ncbi:MAG: metallophosphoesterase [Pseudomonadota bacterium]|nr:metallophosphoesterase [Pseudomonadota bacterium]